MVRLFSQKGVYKFPPPLFIIVLPATPGVELHYHVIVRLLLKMPLPRSRSQATATPGGHIGFIFH